MKNTPATHKEVEDLKVGQAIISEFPNRIQRRSLTKVPRSTKLAQCSMNNPNVVRTKKHKSSFIVKD
jgi:hypothetical protein